MNGIQMCHVPLQQLPHGRLRFLLQSPQVIFLISLEGLTGFSGGKRRRLMELGFIPGAMVTALQRAPFGGAVSYEIMGTVIALRSADARRIGIKIIQ